MTRGQSLRRTPLLPATLLLLLIAASVLPVAAQTSRVTPASFSGSKQPRLAVSTNGQYHVVFGRENEIFLASSTNAGETFAPPVKIGALDKLALGMRRGPRIAAAGQSLLVAAISHADGNLHAWRSPDQGASWSKPVLINNVPASAREGLHDLATDGASNAILVWLDLRSGKTELWSSVSTNSGATWSDNRRVYRSPSGSICECCHPSVIFHNREIVVMWRNSINGSRDMYTATSSNLGKTFSSASRLGNETWKLNACPMDGGSLASNGKNTSFVWRREETVYAFTDESRAPDRIGRGTHPVVTRHRNGFGTVWQDGTTLRWIVNMSAAFFAPLAENASFPAAAWDDRLQLSLVVFETPDAIFLSKRP